MSAEKRNETREEPERQEDDSSGSIVIIENAAEIEQRDDQEIVLMMSGQAIDSYVYSYRQGGRTVEGLTLAGVNEAANRRGGIQVEEAQYEDRENSWIAVVKATDTLTGNSRYGACEQPKKQGGREDPYAFTKAVHKAQRNAVKQLLPTPMIQEVIEFYRQSKRGPQRRPPENKRTALNPPAKDSNESKKSGGAISNQQKAAFASANKLRKPLEQAGVTQEDFWNYVRRRFHVETRNDMSEDHWATLSAELSAASKDRQLFKTLADNAQKVVQAQKDAEKPETDPKEGS